MSARSSAVDSGSCLRTWLVAALRAAKRDVTYHLSPDANHVLKHEPLSTVELRADMAGVQSGYSAEGRVLDPDLVAALLAWIRATANR